MCSAISASTGGRTWPRPNGCFSWESKSSRRCGVSTARTFSDSEAARALAEEQRELAREVGDDWYFANAFITLGAAALLDGEFEQARRFGEEAYEGLQRLGDENTAFAGLVVVAAAEIELGRIQAAFERLSRAVRGSIEVWQIRLLGILTAAVEQSGDDELAARLIGKRTRRGGGVSRRRVQRVGARPLRADASVTSRAARPRAACEPCRGGRGDAARRGCGACPRTGPGGPVACAKRPNLQRRQLGGGTDVRVPGFRCVRAIGLRSLDHLRAEPAAAIVVAGRRAGPAHRWRARRSSGRGSRRRCRGAACRARPARSPAAARLPGERTASRLCLSNRQHRCARTRTSRAHFRATRTRR